GDYYVVAASGDRLVAMNGNGGSSVVTSVDGGATWQTSDLTSLLPAGTDGKNFAMADAGPLGIAVTYQNDPSTRKHDVLLFTVDGVHWSATDLQSKGAPQGVFQSVRVGANHVDITYAVNEGNQPNAKTKSYAVIATPVAP